MGQVTIITGSRLAEHQLMESIGMLIEANIDIETIVLPRSCTTDELKEYVLESAADVFIVGSSEDDTLAGIVANVTDQPVIGVQLDGDDLDDGLILINSPHSEMLPELITDEPEKAFTAAMEFIED